MVYVAGMLTTGLDSLSFDFNYSILLTTAEYIRKSYVYSTVHNNFQNFG